MKLATWNVNGIRARLPRLVAWLRSRQPDVLCMQETKVPNEEFPWKELETVGYRVETHGVKGFNGVAIASRIALEDVTRGFAGDPDPSKPRVIAATADGIRVVNVYVPNGQSVGSDKFAYKLDWYDRFREAIAADHRPTDSILVCGDFNVAPEDKDIYKPERWRDKVLTTAEERGRWKELLAWGFQDGQRVLSDEAGIHTWWDYRLMAFQRGWGLRIDHMLVTDPVARRLRDMTVDTEERAGEKPSDHAPVIATLE